MEIPKTHRELCESLAQAQGTPFVEVILGSPYGESYNKAGEKIGQSQQADVVNPTGYFKQFSLEIYECKMSRSDLLNDIKRGKWEGYLAHCQRFYFAIIEGIGTKEDIPEEAGLMIFHKDKGWHLDKPAKNRKDVVIPEYTKIALILKKMAISNLENKRILKKYYEGNWPISSELKKDYRNFIAFHREIQLPRNEYFKIDIEELIKFYRLFYSDKTKRKLLERFQNEGFWSLDWLTDEYEELRIKVKGLRAEIKELENKKQELNAGRN
jgi:hypothetical protein